MNTFTANVAAVLSAAVCIPASLADDIAPPAYRGSQGTVLVAWEFDAPVDFSSISADTFLFVPTPWSPPTFYTTPRIIAPVPSDWTWNPDGSISATNPAGASLDVIIPGYQGAWDAFARAQYTTTTDFMAPGAQLIPIGWGGSAASILNFADARHASQDFIFYQFGSAQILRLFFSSGTGLSELVVDTYVFPVPTPGAFALAVVAFPVASRRRRVPGNQP